MATTLHNAFQPGGWVDFNGKGADNNFVSSADLLIRDVDPKLYRPFKSKYSSMMTILKMKKALEYNKVYEHVEQLRLMPKVTATNAVAASAGAAATFTVTSTGTPNQQLIQSNQDPYVTSATAYNRGMPIRKYDIIYLKPTSGLVTLNTLIPARVQSVLGFTFTAAPLDPTVTIAVQAVAQEIFIPTNAQGEQSGQVNPLIKKNVLYKNNTQIIKHRTQISGTLQSLKIYGSDGKSYRIAQEQEHYDIFSNLCDGALLFGENTTNPLFDNTDPTTPTQLTKGLAQEAVDNGTLQTYDSTVATPYGVPQIKELVLALNTMDGAKENFMWSGIEFATSVSQGLITYFKDGGMVTLAAMQNDPKKLLELDFKQLGFGGYTFTLQEMDIFNNYQAGGANGYNFRKEALVTPADMNASGEWNVRKRFIPGREMEVTMRDLKQITGEDAVSLDFQAEIGMEVIGVNKLAYITISA